MPTRRSFLSLLASLPIIGGVFQLSPRKVDRAVRMSLASAARKLPNTITAIAATSIKAGSLVYWTADGKVTTHNTGKVAGWPAPTIEDGSKSVMVQLRRRR